MIDKFKGLQKIELAIVSCMIFSVLRIWKISPILGSKFTLFSCAGATLPVLGSFGMSYVVLSLMVKAITSKIATFSLSSLINVLHLPTLCAAYYWSSQSKIISLGVPLVCMMLFFVHPVGWGAAPYACYWLLPIVLSFVLQPSPIVKSFISTFIMHAVGSVIWLYTVPMTSEEWLSLIPVVAVERCCFAGFMILVYYAFVALQKKFGAVKMHCTKIKGLVG